MEYITILLGIILINLILSGDNAVLIALACRNLSLKQRKLSIFWGSAGAIVLRIILTIGAVLLLKIPLLKLIGGVLIVWIAFKLLMQEDESAEDDSKSTSNLWQAIKIIIIADLLMSTDNVLAIAGVSKGNVTLLAVGLATSIPLIILGAQFIVYLMKKFPLIIYIGAGVLGWTGGEMILGDKQVEELLDNALSHNTIAVLEWLIPLALTLFVIFGGYWLNLCQKKRLPEIYQGEKGIEYTSE